MTPFAGAADAAIASPGFGEIAAGTLGVRLATSPEEIAAAQALRWHVFYEEMGAIPDATARVTHRDADAYDAVADHLLVLDHALGEGAEAVVGCYRLIRAPAASRVGRFYSADEYDLSRVLAFAGEVLELGRSCVHADYRNRAVMQLLWRGIAAYVFLHEIGLMFGCASLPGTDPDAVAPELTYLHRNHIAPESIRPVALPHRRVAMDRLGARPLDARAALAALPPLIKGYLRLGGFVGEGAVIDRAFNTVDVAVVVKTDLVTDRYFRHYERSARDNAE